MRKRKESLNVIIIFILTLVLLITPSLQARYEKSAPNCEEAKDNKEVNTVESCPTSRDYKSFLNLELFSLTRKEDNIFNLKLGFEQKKPDFLIEPLKYTMINIRLNSTEKCLYTTSLVTLVALNIADYFSTREALKYKSLEESNPFMKVIVKDNLIYTTVKLGLTAFLYYKMQNLYKKNKKVAWIVSGVLNFVLSYTVAINIILINEVKGT